MSEPDCYSGRFGLAGQGVGEAAALDEVPVGLPLRGVVVVDHNESAVTGHVAPADFVLDPVVGLDRHWL